VAHGNYGAYAVSVNPNFQEKNWMPTSKALKPALKELGDNVRRERVARKMSQQRLAELADLNIRNIQRIEAGELDVLFSTIARVRNALNCAWDRLTPKGW
jgi:ribosome-binding protein aMBF1 (putative translation factor)